MITFKGKENVMHEGGTVLLLDVNARKTYRSQRALVYSKNLTFGSFNLNLSEIQEKLISYTTCVTTVPPGSL